MKTETPRRGSMRQRLFAYMTANSIEYNRLVAARKQALLSKLHGDVLEIGAGAAPNLAFYAPDVHWVGIEPNPAMFSYARREAQRVGRVIELREGKAEQLPVESSSLDAVVSTTVLCSVQDPVQAVQEALRVLKPGGQFVFLEHVAAPKHTRLRRMQRLFRPLWTIAADGCHPDRETWAVIENAGFSDVKIDHFRLNIPILGPHIVGVAVK